MAETSESPLWIQTVRAQIDPVTGGPTIYDDAMCRKYIDDIMASPSATSVLHTLRTLYDGRSPLDQNVHLISFTRALHYALQAITNTGTHEGRRRSPCLDSGIPEFCMDVISKPDFFSECPLWTHNILAFLEHIVLICIENRQSRKYVDIGNMLIDKSKAMLESTWRQREAWNRKDPFVTQSDMRFRTIMPRMIIEFIELSTTCDRVYVMRRTHVVHIAVSLWYHTPLGEVHNPTLGLAAGHLHTSTTGDRPATDIKESALDIFGAENLLRRFHRDLDDSTMINEDLSICLQAINAFVLHPEVQTHVGPLETYKHVFDALDRQKVNGLANHEFDIYSRAAVLLVLSSSAFPPSMCLKPMLEKYDLVGVMARGAILCAENNCGKDNTEGCISLIEHHGELLGSPILPAGRNHWTHLVKAATRRDWYPTLCRLRELRPRRGSVPPAYTRLVRAWEKFGKRARMDEAAEKERFARAEAKKAKGCSWTKCQYHEKETEAPMPSVLLPFPDALTAPRRPRSVPSAPSGCSAVRPRSPGSTLPQCNGNSDLLRYQVKG